MKDLFKNKLLWSFVGGVAATVAGSKFAKSDCARKVAVKSVATGMQLKDQTLVSYDTIVEDAKDIYAEAKSKKEAK
ncbi:DUF6110 family protein [Catenibacterium sp. co_0103]|uniref:DUF6110 family protein n=1 Tax=Catenibacterium sp. co_0103 TaxID=2478954 RepID=UPI00247A69D0|nr:DUF6110 family protein [Catenibacterium sp. co_0103]